MERETLERKTIEHGARFGFVRAVADVDADRLGSEERFHHAPQRGQHAVERAGKADPFAPWPGKPGRGMQFPFRRHPIAKRRGRRV